MFVRHHVPAAAIRVAGFTTFLALFCLSLSWPRVAYGQSDDVGLECARRVVVETSECYNEADGYFDKVKCELAEIRDLIECTGIDWTDVMRQIVKL